MFQFPEERVGRGAFGYGKVVFLLRIRNDDVMDTLPTTNSRVTIEPRKDEVVLEPFIPCLPPTPSFLFSSLSEGGRKGVWDQRDFAKEVKGRSLLKEVCIGG